MSVRETLLIVSIGLSLLSLTLALWTLHASKQIEKMHKRWEEEDKAKESLKNEREQADRQSED